MSGRGAFHFSEITLTQIYAVYVVGRLSALGSEPT
jgi:hypothetical protein